jgi:hypothetical protein
MNRETLIEVVFLAVLFGLLVFIGPGEVFQHQLVHNKPVYFGAGDGYLYAMFSNWVYDQGDFRHNPPYGSASFTDSIAYHPPMLPQVSAAFAHLSGLHGHDALPLLMALFVIAGAFMMYWLIRGYNRTVALLASALFVFLYVDRFIIGYVWGQALLHMGTFFLIALFFLVSKPELKYWWVPAGILIAGTINAHTSETVFFYGFGVFFLVTKLVLRQLTMQDVRWWVRQLVFATLLAMLLSFNFLTIFYHGYYQTSATEITFKPMKPEDFGAVRAPPVQDFHTPALIAIILGAVLALVLARKQAHPALVASGYMFLVGLANYIGVYYRAFQTRFIWPVHLAVFFGLTLYFIVKKFAKAIIIPALVALIIAGVFVHAYYKPMHPDIIYNEQWQGVEWLYANTPEDARILFLYGDGYSQWIRMVKRLVFLVDTNDLVAMAQEGKLRRTMIIEPMLQNDLYLLYRQGWFTFGQRAKEQNITIYPGPFDVCGFDYYVVDRRSAHAPQLAQVNVQLGNVLLAHNMTLGYQNEHLVILKNTNVGGECLA